MFGTAFLDAMYRATGKMVSYKPAGSNAVQATGYAIFNAPGVVGMGGLLTDDPSVRYPLHQFPEVTKGGVFQFGTDEYRVRQAPQKLIDGMEATCALERAQ